MFTHSLISEKITAYIRISVKQLKCAIHAEQLKDSLIQWVQQRLATPLKNRNNLIRSEMTMNINMNSEVIMTSETQLNVTSILSNVQKCWTNINDVVYYNSKIYVLQISALCNAVISQFHDDVFTDHFRKSKTAELMCQFYDWSDTVRDVQCYCHDCVKCQKMKSAHHKSYRLLNSLSVSIVLWHTVTVNFITDLSLSSIYRSTT